MSWDMVYKLEASDLGGEGVGVQPGDRRWRGEEGGDMGPSMGGMIGEVGKEGWVVMRGEGGRLALRAESSSLQFQLLNKTIIQT